VTATIAWTAAATWLILTTVRAFTPLRIPARDEAAGIDVGQHGEEGYSDGEGAILVLDPSITRGSRV